MRAEERILSLLEASKNRGELQSEIARKLNLSKSTVSEILSVLEEKKAVIRAEISPKSYRVWLTKYYPQPIPGVMRIGILKASEYVRVVSAGRKVGAIFRIYRNGIEATKDLVHGVVDVVASPLITQAFFGVLMKNIKIFRAVAMNGSGVAFSVGKGFGCSEFSTMERILRKFMKAKGIDERIKFFDSPEDMISELPNLYGIAIWEPYLSMLGSVEHFDTVLGDFVCCSLAVNEDFLEINKDLFDKFLEKYDNSSPKEGVEPLAELTGFSKDLIARSLSSYEFDVGFEEVKKDIGELRFGGIEEILSL
ncbi:MAG: winged helix-turn-helix transcriptional regulator [Archaeoglobales archaeon]|jgi:predicted transcriptional regulator|nr:winged helix-turn-helix transcriptional regulator [Archaeoglobi archaeon]NHW23829.1 winged helix-turn-helix transcriptional regulator [Archaeoglobales archaeon]